ncbi:hypothetical protein ACGFX2_35130 [Streptomyces goshikiensis]|uniref:hypothetical protein n=1 Tax=Streptomyces goshikiensis TaxID=1942 RepID=UPI00371A7C06
MRDPELREIVVPRENAGGQAVRLFLTTRGAPDVDNRTHTPLTCIDGLVFDRRVSGGEVRREALEGRSRPPDARSRAPTVLLEPARNLIRLRLRLRRSCRPHAETTKPGEPKASTPGTGLARCSLRQPSYGRHNAARRVLR